MTKDEAISFARGLKTEDPDIQVRPIPVGDERWLVVVHVGLFRFTVQSRSEFDASMSMIFGQPSPETILEAYSNEIRELAQRKSLRRGMAVDDIMQITAARAISMGIVNKDQLLEIASRTIELAM
ncbi:MAG: hypothetical protein SFV81_20235 [Pirellulaceae bacterium]|nr:hypothetical protein [Pirellulaceae bacterium]